MTSKRILARCTDQVQTITGRRSDWGNSWVAPSRAMHYACGHPRTKRGYKTPRCVSCHRQSVRRYYQRNRARILAHKRRYRLLSPHAVEAEIDRNARRRTMARVATH